MSPFVRPRRPFVIPAVRGPRSFTRPFVIPWRGDGFGLSFGAAVTWGAGAGRTGAGRAGPSDPVRRSFARSSSWTFSWIATWPRASSSSAMSSSSRNFAPHFGQRAAFSETGVSQRGHATTISAASSSAASVSSARFRLTRASFTCPSRAWSFVLRTQRPGYRSSTFESR